jgi:hypothetical protein
MRWAEHVARKGEGGGTTNAYGPSVGKPKETDRLEDMDTDEQIILKQILNMT